MYFYVLVLFYTTMFLEIIYFLYFSKTMADILKIVLCFGGGAELLFDKVKKRSIELPALNKYFPESSHHTWTIKDLLVWIKDNLLRERPELFLQVISNSF